MNLNTLCFEKIDSSQVHKENCARLNTLDTFFLDLSSYIVTRHKVMSYRQDLNNILS